MGVTSSVRSRTAANSIVFLTSTTLTCCFVVVNKMILVTVTRVVIRCVVVLSKMILVRRWVVEASGAFTTTVAVSVRVLVTSVAVLVTGHFICI